MDLTSNAVGTKTLYFVHLELPSVNAPDELKTFGTPSNRVRKPIDGFNWSATGNVLDKLQRLE